VALAGKEIEEILADLLLFMVCNRGCVMSGFGPAE